MGIHLNLAVLLREIACRHRLAGRVATLAEKVGNKTYGWRLQTIAPLAREALDSTITEAHRGGKEADRAQAQHGTAGVYTEG